MYELQLIFLEDLEDESSMYDEQTRERIKIVEGKGAGQLQVLLVCTLVCDVENC
jgi:hypothetical protein